MEFKLPDIGEGVHEGEITKWLVQTGQQIQADQPMVEVMTDKATVEIPSPVTGTVADIMFKEGQTVEVGKVILRIDEAGKAKAAPAAAPAKEAPAAEQAARSGPALGPGTRCQQKRSPRDGRRATSRGARYSL
jgi:pyruvate dehydrogenase E2 component (dihydrolipoamide acetyltransferase)